MTAINEHFGSNAEIHLATLPTSLTVSTLVYLRALYPGQENPSMNSTPTEFHKVWIDQCVATESIRESFGSQNALDYLIGEKLFSFLHAAERDPLFAAEVPAFIGEIQQLFTAQEIRDYLDQLECRRYLAPQEVELEPEPDEVLEEEEVWLENPVMGAEELLRFSRVRELLEA
jgi:hypothetical protein